MIKLNQGSAQREIYKQLINNFFIMITRAEIKEKIGADYIGRSGTFEKNGKWGIVSLETGKIIYY